MKYGIFGPKQNGEGGIYDNLAHVAACLATITDIEVLISGGGKGIEHLSECYAAQRGIPVVKVRPDFHSLFGSDIKNPNMRIDDVPTSLRHQVFAARNDSIMERADRIVVFWDGQFFEIGQLIKRALALKKPVLLFSI